MDQRWRRTTEGTPTDRLRYGYDRDGNVLYKENEVNAVLSEVFGYDSLKQLSTFQRGTLNASKDGVTGTPNRSQSWDVDGPMPKQQSDPDLECLWRDRMARWHASGISVRLFCAAGHLDKTAFYLSPC